MEAVVAFRQLFLSVCWASAWGIPRGNAELSFSPMEYLRLGKRPQREELGEVLGGGLAGMSPGARDGAWWEKG